LAVLILGLPSQQPDREEEIKVHRAQFKDGKPAGFARKQGVEPEALKFGLQKKGEFVLVRQIISVVQQLKF